MGKYNVMSVSVPHAPTTPVPHEPNPLAQAAPHPAGVRVCVCVCPTLPASTPVTLIRSCCIQKCELAAVERNGDDSRPRQAQSTDERLEVIEQLLRKVAICVLFDNRTIWRIRGTTRPIPRHIA